APKEPRRPSGRGITSPRRSRPTPRCWRLSTRTTRSGSGRATSPPTAWNRTATKRCGSCVPLSPPRRRPADDHPVPPRPDRVRRAGRSATHRDARYDRAHPEDRPEVSARAVGLHGREFREPAYERLDGSRAHRSRGGDVARRPRQAHRQRATHRQNSTPLVHPMGGSMTTIDTTGLRTRAQSTAKTGGDIHIAPGSFLALLDALDRAEAERDCRRRENAELRDELVAT